jgi:hypothetical protein
MGLPVVGLRPEPYFCRACWPWLWLGGGAQLIENQPVASIEDLLDDSISD